MRETMLTRLKKKKSTRRIDFKDFIVNTFQKNYELKKVALTT